MSRIKKIDEPRINSSSMADIAFLLLIFFLVTTTIASDRGLYLPLPPDPEKLDPVKLKTAKRNLFKIQINSADLLFVEGETMQNIGELKELIKGFVLNYGKDPQSSDSPLEAIVSLKTDRGTTQAMFISVLDEIQGAYYDIYAERAKVTNQHWRTLVDHLENPGNRKLYNQGRGRTPDGKVGIPMNISIAEPTNAVQ